MLKKLLGIAPQPTGDGAYSPSPLARKLAVPQKTDYAGADYPTAAAAGSGRILVLGTEHDRLTTTNGKVFATGNHPVELYVPLLHFRAGGFALDVVTPTGRPVRLEEWALPREDAAVMDLHREMAPALAAPRSLRDLLPALREGGNNYAAVFIPGGHGALLGLPEDEAVGELLGWALGESLYVVSICHGPAALLALPERDFPLAGYKIAAFPDAADKTTPYLGYMPGHLPWYFGKALRERGMTIVNGMPDASCHADRQLITGASPLAADPLGRLATQILLAERQAREVA